MEEWNDLGWGQISPTYSHQIRLSGEWLKPLENLPTGRRFSWVCKIFLRLGHNLELAKSSETCYFPKEDPRARTSTGASTDTRWWRTGTGTGGRTRLSLLQDINPSTPSRRSERRPFMAYFAYLTSSMAIYLVDKYIFSTLYSYYVQMQSFSKKTKPNWSLS